MVEKPLLTLKQAWTPQFNASFSRDGKYLVTSGPGKYASIWDLQTRQIAHILKPANQQADYVWSVAFSDDNKHVVTAGQDGTVNVWDVATGLQQADFRRHHGPVLSAIFNRWGNVVISTGTDKTVQSWNWTDPNTYERYRDYVGHRDWVWSAARSRTGDVNYLATCGRDGNIFIWNFDRDIAPLYTIDTHAGTVYDAQFSGDNTRLVTAGSDHISEVWYFPIPILLGLGSHITHVEFSPDGAHTLVSSADGHVYQGSIHAGTGQLRFDGDGRSVFCAGYSPDGKRIAAAGANNLPRIWIPQPAISAQDGYFQELKGHSKEVYSIAFSSDGSQVITASADGAARIWDALTGTCLQTLNADAGPVLYGALSGNKKTALTAGRDGSARLWDARTKTVLHTFTPARSVGRSGKPPSDYPNTAVFSPDARHVLTADTNHQAYLWDVKTGQMEAVLSGHTDSVQSACFSHDGKRIVTASRDQTLRLWDVQAVLQAGRSKQTPVPLFHINVGGRGAMSACFSPDGRQILVGCYDGTSKLYPATLTAFLHKAHEILQQVPPP